MGVIISNSTLNFFHKKFYLLLSITIVVFLVTLSTAASNADTGASSCSKQTVVNGIIDLRCWDGKSKILLNGSWQLDYKSRNENTLFQDTAVVPGRWRNMDPALPFLGRGVYRTKILLKEPLDHLGLQLTRAELAEKIVIVDANGHETMVFDSGKTDIAERSIVKMHIPIIDLPKLGTESTLIITLNNSETLHGGFEAAPVIGPINDLVLHEQIMRLIAVAMASILTMFTFLNLFFGWVRGRDHAQLMLGLLTFPFALRQLSMSGVLYDFFPNLTTLTDSAIGWATFFAPIIFGFNYFKTIYPTLIPRWIPIIVYIASALGIIIFVFLPLYYVQMYGVYYRPIVLVAMLGLMGSLIYGLKNPDPELKYTVMSASLLIVIVALDVLTFIIFEYSSIFSVAAFGMVIFTGMQTVLISNRYLHSLQQAATLGKEMKALNTNLEVIVKDRTAELAEKNMQLEKIARTDPLTGLANRRALDDVILKEVGRGKRSGKPMVVGIMDLDFFKKVNDTHGHDIGDLVLKEVATMLVDSLRTGDFSARWGGEEFCIVFPETQGDQAISVCERLREIISKHAIIAGEVKLSVTVSIGLAVWQEGREIDEVFKDADQALYTSKGAGRNQVTASWS